MKKMKRFAAMVFAGVMAAAMVFPSMAYNPKYMTGSTEIIEEDGVRWASGHLRTYPGWAWINGYCYYYTDYIGGNKLTNCVTPDGYTVDAEGRWTENGVPQSNGYGSFVIGTDELYAGKTDEQRWEVMRRLLENLYANHIPGSEYSIALRADKESVMGNLSKEGFAGWDVTHNTYTDERYYLSIDVANGWNDSPELYGNYKNELIEQTIKIVCGDHVGQELFNDIKAAADPVGGNAKQVPELDENGNWIWIDEDHIKMKTIEASSDGINFDMFDINKWNSRLTDYGKVIKITPGEKVNGRTVSWHLGILQ